MNLYNLSLIFGEPASSIAYVYVSTYLLHSGQMLLYLIAFLFLLDIILFHFRAENNYLVLKPSKNFTHALDALFVLSLTVYIFSMMVTSIGLVYNSGEVINGDVFGSEVLVSLEAAQWYWNAFLLVDVLNATLLCYETVVTDVMSIYSSEEEKRNMSTTHLPLPVLTDIILRGTSADVIHSFGLPCAGVKFDCIPGRVQYSHVDFYATGFYDAHCYELCGSNHAYMQLTLCVVLYSDFYHYIQFHRSFNSSILSDAWPNNVTNSREEMEYLSSMLDESFKNTQNQEAAYGSYTRY